MSAKKVAVVTLSSAVAVFYAKLLYSLFGDLIQVIPYNFEDGSAAQLCPADLFIVSTSAAESYQDAKMKLPEGSSFIISNITITKSALKQLQALPAGTRALLVNLSHKMAMEVISDLHHLGINHIEFIPCYPFSEPVPDVDLAITPDELRYVPSDIKRVINLGQRTFDASTIVEAAIRLGFEHLLDTDVFQRYFHTLPTDNYSLNHLFVKTFQLESQFDLLLSVLDVGVIGVDYHNRVFASNQVAEKITGLEHAQILGRNAASIVPFIPFEECAKIRSELRTRLVRFKERNINVSVFPVVRKGEYIGAFAIIQDFTDEENKQHKLRAQLMSQGHQAKYTFDDIIGSCPSMEKTKEIAKKMALTNLPILITGESGTGKELFSQAIHNYSARNDGPFVAINCASIPDTLLESELFGYEEGAFTGAKKGGKLGLFEFAHRGTLLLDEIEGMSPNLQVKLLRAIQEKEVMRVGGNKIIHVDVRLIAASNMNLEELIEAKAFRKDLFYRLSTLPLYIPPLREREGDLGLLIEEIKTSLGIKFTLSPTARDVLYQHPFPGNVRELRNYVEYLACIGGDYIDYDALPISVKANYERRCQAAPASDGCSAQASALLQLAGSSIEDYLFLLKSLLRADQSAHSIGRRSLKEAAQAIGLQISDNEIRRALHEMDSMNLVKISRGRGATKITLEGQRVYHELSKTITL